jgi:hypothetical protein
MGLRVLTNDPWGPADLKLEPLETPLYNYVRQKVDLDAVVMVPPTALADISLVTAMHHVTRACVCIYQWRGCLHQRHHDCSMSCI